MANALAGIADKTMQHIAASFGGRNSRSLKYGRERSRAIASTVIIHRAWLGEQHERSLIGPCPCGCGGKVSPRYTGDARRCLVGARYDG